MTAPVGDAVRHPPAWMTLGLGLCAQVDPEVFYPDKGESTRPAKQICSRCEYLNECLEYALQNREPHGVWGGASHRERRQMLRDRDKAGAQ